MVVDWSVVSNIAAPIIALVIGLFVDRWLEKKAKLISYLGHVSSFNIKSVEEPFFIFTHSIVVRNAGRSPANDVRVGHYELPKDFHVYPSRQYKVEELAGGGAEIVFSNLVPDEQVTISYIYFPPLTFDKINSYTKSDEGFAKVLRVLPTPQLPKWAISILWFLIFVGVTSLLYLLFELVSWLLR